MFDVIHPASIEPQKINWVVIILILILVIDYKILMLMKSSQAMTVEYLNRVISTPML